MADNHSPYDPDPRQGRGGDRRTQALQAVSFFSIVQAICISFRQEPQDLRWVETRVDTVLPLPPNWSDVSAPPASSATELRQHTFGSTIVEFSNRNDHKSTPIPHVDNHFLRVRGNRSIRGQRQLRRGDTFASGAQNVPRKEPPPEQKSNTRILYILRRGSICPANR